MVAAVILLAVGLVTVAYSSTQLSRQTVIFDQSSVQIGSASYVGQDIAVNLGGTYLPIVKGGVGSVGCCVDFYLVPDVNWNTWSTNPAMRDALSTVHLNSTAVSSQSPQGQFSFVPSSPSYSIIFLNGEYPNATGTQNVHAMITLQYVPLASLYVLFGGLAVVVVGLSLLFIAFRTRSRATGS